MLVSTPRREHRRDNQTSGRDPPVAKVCAQSTRQLDPAGGNAASTCPREDCVPLRTPCSKRSAAQSFSVSVVDAANQKTTYDGSHQPIYEGRGRPQRAKERRRVDTHATADVAFPESFSRTLICLLDARMLCAARAHCVSSLKIEKHGLAFGRPR